MRKGLRITALVLMFLVLAIGYAQLADNLSIMGDAYVEGGPYEGIYISDIAYFSSSGATSESFDHFNPTNMETTINASATNASVTYKVTVHNNTDVTYWYINQVVMPDYESNHLINTGGGISVVTKDAWNDPDSSFNSNDWVPPRTYRDFYVTYTFGANARGQHTTVINFKFDIKMDAIHDQFLAVLNDRVSDRGYYYLSDAFNDKYAETGSTVIGSVGEDLALFDELFGSGMTVNIDGTERPVTVLISRRNVDNRTTGDGYPSGPSGCEYTIYITVENLNDPKNTVTVYAVSYSCKDNGVWYQLGELYEGTTIVTDYDPSTSAHEGAFDVMAWDATPKEYDVMGNYSYKVGFAQGEVFDMYDTIEEIMSTTDQSFVNRVNNSKEFLIEVCRTLYTYAYNPQYNRWDESPNVANMYKPGYEGLKEAFEDIKDYCQINNGGADVRLKDNVGSLATRAELIPLLEAVQVAYNYYVEVSQ